ncbi:MAG: serine/threonine-protein kinase, partial [Hyphomicrobiaceae bacterium]
MGRQPLPTNTILGVGTDQYRIDTVLGPGGFGVTYLARDLRTGREVAVKEYFPAEFAYREGSTTVRPSTHGTSQSHFDQGKRHFLAEASTLAKFRHPHIVRVLNLFEQFVTAYMVLEFEEGQSLKSWLRTLGRRPSQADLDALLGPLLDALVQVHSKGMFHRDIAPDNIIVRPAGDPVLIDFGAARNFVREHSFTLGPVVKHGYSPPEQYTRDTRLQGAWSDIYSLSATIYAALMGKPPEEASRRQLNDTALPVSRHLEPARRALYRPSFIAAVDAGLQLRPKDRPQTAEDFRRLVLGEEAQSRRIASRLSGSGASRLSSDRPAAASLAPASRASEPADRPLPPPGVLPKGGAPDDAYPESAARTAGLAALAVATLAAVLFLMLGGIGHPAGMATVMLVCGSLVVAGLERLLAVTRSSPA